MDLIQEEWSDKQIQTVGSRIIDVRTPDEYEAGHLPNSQLINIREPQAFMDDISSLDKTQSYFVYCRSGARSAQACQILKQQGIENCYNLLGGILEWKGEIE
jgi:rhodanese-related sulfurtransferase